MLYLTEHLSLKEINRENYSQLYFLMRTIYPLAYSHFWTDKGDWYVNTQYSEENILRELSEEKSEYYYVVFNDEIIGNFRIIWDEKLEGLSEGKQVKLHRIYLHQKIQGKGIGKNIVSWLENKAKEKGYKIIWLDAMNEQPQALSFYKNLGFKYHSYIFLEYDLLHQHVRKMIQVYKIL
ncbi:MAG: GNAT family N-acetyltransferase [Polaribacter sp.]|nr:GNAT family N-acetyltransferase [Polaribacter sp.]